MLQEAAEHAERLEEVRQSKALLLKVLPPAEASDLEREWALLRN